MKTSFIFLGLALLAFLGLGLDVVLVLIETLFYGTSDFWNWGLIPTLVHWTIICIVWGLFAYMLYRISKKQGFDIFENKAKPSTKNVLIVLGLIAICVIVSYINWHFQFKPVVEFIDKGVIAFIFQYVYYFFECTLVLLTVVFGQKFGEETFKVKHTQLIPWGGFLCGLTWGLGHIFTQSLTTGLTLWLLTVLYGGAYLLLKKNTIYAYIAITLMFIL